MCGVSLAAYPSLELHVCLVGRMKSLELRVSKSKAIRPLYDFDLRSVAPDTLELDEE
jgi:hypothetical protein